MREVALSADGNSLYFDVLGQGTPALVFVHGWSCDRSYWKGQIDHFAAEHRVVAMDLAGHGESGIERPTWTMPAFGEDVAAVIENLHLEKVVLVGHSMGGDVIVETALQMPERVVGLVWVDTYRTLGSPESREELDEFVEQFRQDFATATRELVRGMFPAGADSNLVEWVAADMASAPPRIAVDALGHAIGNHDLVVAGLRQLTVPVVAINPDYRPTDVKALRKYGVRTVLVPGVGHYPMMEDADTFNRILDKVLEDFQLKSD